MGVDVPTPAAKAMKHIVNSIALKDPQWVDNAPAPKSFKFRTPASNRFKIKRIWKSPSYISYMSRPKTLKTVVLDPIQEALKSPGDNRRIYIDGGQGVGKSHLLLEAVLLLQKNPQFRVLYIHDCYSLTDEGTENEAAALALKDYITDCLNENDLAASQIKSALKAKKFSLKKLLLAVTEHLESVGCELIMVFDQYNAIASKGFTFWSSYPWSIPLYGATGAITIASSSTNNEAYAKVPKDTRKVMFWDSFDDSEYRVWKTRMVNGIPDWDDDAARATTRRVPMFLADLVDAVNGCKNVFAKGLEAYERNQIEQMSLLYNDFFDYRTKDNQEYKATARLMELAIVSQTLVEVHNPQLMDRRFCFRDAKRELTMPHHPLFAMMLVQVRGRTILDSTKALLQAYLDYCNSSDGREPPNSGDIIELGVMNLLRNSGISTKIAISKIKGGEIDNASKGRVFIKKDLPIRWVRPAGTSLPDVLATCLHEFPPSQSSLYFPVTRSLPQVDCFVYMAECRTLYAVQITKVRINTHVPILYKTEHLPQSWIEEEVKLQRLWIGRPFKKKLKKKAHLMEGDLLCDISTYSEFDSVLHQVLEG
ncbi:hypothetical protein HDU96_010468 [Phlyctochytrium bullatum]|nr:hypothetical protein HDU96_010468 [Phlyctochytrium bullatum]